MNEDHVAREGKRNNARELFGRKNNLFIDLGPEIGNVEFPNNDFGNKVFSPKGKFKKQKVRGFFTDKN